jgi:ABC-2 type transport system permease protein
MSAATATLGRDKRVGLPQLTRVELRKTYDTRAGFWILIAGVLLMLATGLITVFSGDASHTWSNVLNNCSQALNFIFPVVGILLVTSEWSQRTALTTFTLVPQRGRVLVTKISASVVLSIVATVATLVISALCTAVHPAATDAFHLDAGRVLQTLLFTIISMLTGVGLGAAILVSAPAIVALFVLPIGYSAIVNLVGAFHGLRDWTDQGDTFNNLPDHVLSSHEWAQVATASLLWVVLPLAIGAYRFLRGEIR